MTSTIRDMPKYLGTKKKKKVFFIRTYKFQLRKNSSSSLRLDVLVCHTIFSLMFIFVLRTKV